MIEADQWETMDEVVEAALHTLRAVPAPVAGGGDCMHFKRMLRERIEAHERNPVLVDPR